MNNQVAQVSKKEWAAAEPMVPVGYKQTEVGVIPEDWELSDIKHISALPMQNGLFYEPRRKGTGVPLINVGDMYAAAPIDVDTLELFDATENEIKVFRVKLGDLFFTRSSVVPSGIAYCNIFNSESDDVVFDSHLIRVRPNTEIIDSKYLYLNCISKHARAALISEAKTATMTTIDQGAINRCPVLVPPRKEQTAIANALSDMDTLIGSLEDLIAKKQAIKTATMQQLLTGRTRLPLFATHPDGSLKGYKTSELGEIPEDWEVVTLEVVVEKIVGGGTPSRSNSAYWGSDIPWVTVKDFTTFSSTSAQESITKLGLVNSASNLIPRGTLITSTRMALGKAVIYEVDVAINQDLKAIFPASDLDTKFLYFWFENNSVKIDDLGSGSTVKGLSLSGLRKIPFLRLSKQEQTAIATILSDMDEDIQALEARLAKTRDLKQGMMQQLLTGKIRLVKPLAGDEHHAG
ncbi:restriction endonuclease subunit S [Oceanimonas smirnovii]|uniref:restriction endonuclease subunit S n=1 Tax=Oceanimonas smirnovii TaxID=264574 RepID=UPI00376F90D0